MGTIRRRRSNAGGVRPVASARTAWSRSVGAAWAGATSAPPTIAAASPPPPPPPLPVAASTQVRVAMLATRGGPVATTTFRGFPWPLPPAGMKCLRLASVLSGRFHPRFRDKNRRDIGKSQSQWTPYELETPGSRPIAMHRVEAFAGLLLGSSRQAMTAAAADGPRCTPSRPAAHAGSVRQQLLRLGTHPPTSSSHCCLAVQHRHRTSPVCLLLRLPNQRRRTPPLSRKRAGERKRGRAVHGYNTGRWKRRWDC
jgi:hypothetical protein